MPAVSFSATGTAPEDTAWEWNAAAQNAILGDSGDNWSRYKQAHAWWDGSSGDDAEKKAAYKLPHHRMGDSGLEAVWHGVSNAMARLSQADIPEDEVSATFDHLASHYKQWDKDPPEKERWMSTWRDTITKSRQKTPAAPVKPVTRREAMPLVATRAAISSDARPNGQPTDGDMAMINSLARSPLSPDQVYVFPAEISSDAIDAYFTRMTPKSLANYAATSARGVALCDSHVHTKLPIGRSFAGEVVPVERDGRAALTTQALAYTLRGLNVSSGLNTDDVIRGIEAGIYTDVSIGFIPEAFWCSICGLNMLTDWSCYHWPGQEYEVNPGGKNAEPEMVTCIADVDADLAEYSLVYDGATPNAMVLKAEAEVERGRATGRLLAFVEDRCRIKLFDRFGGVTLPVASQVATPAPSEQEEDMRGSDFVRAVMERAGKTISSANMDRLNGILDGLTGGHDTMEEAINQMASFLAENAETGADQKEEADGEKAAPEPEMRASDSGAKGKSSNKKDDPDGDGDADATDENAAESEDDEDHLEPGTDDGDGDDDEPTREDGDEEDTTDEGDKEDAEDEEDAKQKKRQAPEAPAPIDPLSLLPESERALLEYGRKARIAAIDDALAWGARAYGVNFADERYRAILERASMEEIAQFATDWQETAKVALSSRGTFVPDPKAPGGGYWTTEPTGMGGRQTAARDPNDPVGVSAAGGRPAITGRAASQAAKRGGTGDVTLYKTGRTRR